MTDSDEFKVGNSGLECCTTMGLLTSVMKMAIVTVCVCVCRTCRSSVLHSSQSLIGSAMKIMQ